MGKDSKRFIYRKGDYYVKNSLKRILVYCWFIVFLWKRSISRSKSICVNNDWCFKWKWCFVLFDCVVRFSCECWYDYKYDERSELLRWSCWCNYVDVYVFVCKNVDLWY